MAELDDDETVSIKKKKTKRYIVKPGFESNFTYIKSKFTIIAEGMNKLQTIGLSLINCVQNNWK